MSEAVLFGSYELLDRIAEGGMAEVWRARSRGVAGFEKTVVIKRVLPALMVNPGFAEMLVREAKIAALLSHPNIVQIFDLGEERGAYFIAMEYVQGRDLGAAMTLAEQAARARLPLPLKLWIVSEVAKALDYAHRRRGEDGRPLNIVHRDVSPHNVLLGFEGAVKVADFGIARADQQELGRGEDPKVLRGKYAYMSPEQASGEPLDRRSDLFSLGIVLWELVVGRRLFRGQTAGETLELVRRAEVPPVPPGVDLPEGLEAIFDRVLARDREQRYGAAAELQADLTAVLIGMGSHVDEADLAEAMHQMFPRDDQASPNKLSVDVMLRAYDDAAALSHAGRDLDPTPTAEPNGGTRAFPSSRRLRAETRQVVLLAARHREEDGAAFEAAVRSFGGTALRPRSGVREGVFGHASAGERAAEHAARAALEIRRRLTVEGRLRVEPVPTMVVASGPATVFEGEAVEPHEELQSRAAAVLQGRWPGEIRVEEALVEELSRTFSFTEGSPPVLEGFRARGDREALALRRRGPLCGRRDEMRILTESLAGAATGQGEALLLLGEAGSGKSRLIAELRTLAAAQDVVVLHGAGDEAEQERSYVAFADLFADLCGLEDDDRPEARFEKVERLRVLGLPPREVRRVGELLGLAYPTALRERVGRPRGLDLVIAARRALRAVAQDRAVLLVLEDLQWMDDSSRQQLPLLLRGLSGSPVLALLTARLGTALPRLDARPLALGPLPRPACGRLFAWHADARAVEEDLADRVYAETAGNPRWVEAMAEALRGSDHLRIDRGVAHADDAETVLPAAECAVVAARLAQLRPEERDLARLAALFERGVDLAILSEVHGLPRDVAERPLRRLLLSGFLVSSEDPARAAMAPLQVAYPGTGSWGGGHVAIAIPPRVCVPGQLLRRAILQTVSEGERRRMHGRVAAVLERRGAHDDPERVDDLAYHAARSVDRRRAPEYLVRAAEAARRAGRPREAAERFAEAARLLQLAAGEAPGFDVVDLALSAAELAIDAGDDTLAERVLLDTGEQVPRDDAPALVRLALARARAAQRRDGWMDAVFALAEVSDAVDRLSDAALRGRALFEWGRAELEAGRPERAVALLTRAQEASAEEAPAIGGRALCARAVALARLARVDEADQAVASALAIAARLGTGELRHLALAAMAEAHAARGALVDAAARWAEAAEVASQLGAAEEAARLEAHAAVSFAEAGVDDRAVALAERAVAQGKRLRVESAWQLATAAQAALVISAHPDAAWLPRLERAAGRLEELGRYGEASRALQMLHRARRALGYGSAATQALAKAAELARAGGHLALATRQDALRAAEE